LNPSKTPNKPENVTRTIDELDWAATPLGPRSEWPLSLQAVVKMALGSKFPQAIVWGPAYTTIHNDAFLPILDEKPSAIADDFQVVPGLPVPP